VRRAYKLRAYPTRPQEVRAVRLLADHCDLYNAALQERREAWRMAKVSVAYGDQSAQLKEIRAADPDGQGRHSFTAQQQTLRGLNVVFAAYYKRVRGAEKGRQQAGRGEKPKERTIGYPRFKPRQRFNQVLFVVGDGARWEPADCGRRAYATTSIDCHACGAKCGRPRQDTVVCPLHGKLDADLNGARNIATRAGLGSGQASVA
jgi:transposase